uniref:BCL2 family apoptosis regulator BOK b n=1 Tax=Astyanax mexicanus TaxID=7994 RepID=W5KF74_ASTMX
MDLMDRGPSEKELVFQSKILCRDFIYSRITREGLNWSKVESSLPVPVPDGALGDVSMVLLKLGDELEYMRPYIYRNVAKQLSISVSVESVVSDAFLSVATEILSLGITWGKVVAIFAVAGGSGGGLCPAGSSSHDTHYSGQPGGVRPEEPGALAEEERRLGRHFKVCDERGHYTSVPLDVCSSINLEARCEDHVYLPDEVTVEAVAVNTAPGLELLGSLRLLMISELY